MAQADGRTKWCHKSIWSLVPLANTIHTSSTARVCIRTWDTSDICIVSTTNAGNLPRIKSAHVMITLHSTIHDCGIALLPDSFPCLVRIRPAWIAPHAWVYLTELYWRARVICDGFFEGGIEVSVIKEDIWIVIPAIEMSLDRLYRFNDAVQFLVAGQYYERRICPGCWRINLLAAGHKDFVVLFTYFSLGRSVLADVKPIKREAVIPYWGWCASRNQHAPGFCRLSHE